MRQLSKIESFIYLIGGLLMTVGAGCCAFLWQQRIFVWVYLFGAVCFVAMQMRQRYEGDNFIVKRLRRIMILSGVFFIIAGVLMVETQYQFIKPLMTSHYQNYIDFIYNKWVAFLLAGAILQLYSTHRISNELQKD